MRRIKMRPARRKPLAVGGTAGLHTFSLPIAPSEHAEPGGGFLPWKRR